MLITHHPVLPDIIARCFGWRVRSFPGLGEFVDAGKDVVSLPHFSYGNGPLPAANLFLTLEKVAEYNEIVKSISKKLRKTVEIRFPSLFFLNQRSIYKVASWYNLDQNLFSNPLALRGNLGRKIRKAVGHGLQVETGGAALLTSFYSVYELRLHELGSAALPLSFFRELLLAYPDKTLKADARVYVIRKNDEVMGGAITLFYGTFAENTWFSTTRHYNHLYPSYLLHAVMMKDAVDWGCHIYSFGRSTLDSGVHHFKRQWGTFDVPLVWLRYPEANFSLRNFPFLQKIWKHVPLNIARPFNHYLAKWMF